MCSGQLGTSEECLLSEWVDGVTMPFLSVQGKQEQPASSPRVVQTWPSLFAKPRMPAPICPSPILVGCLGLPLPLNTQIL